jgi:Arc/MetJ-type ribon-helix-helix transcriptional regulator
MTAKVVTSIRLPRQLVEDAKLAAEFDSLRKRGKGVTFSDFVRKAMETALRERKRKRGYSAKIKAAQQVDELPAVESASPPQPEGV